MTTMKSGRIYGITFFLACLASTGALGCASSPAGTQGGTGGGGGATGTNCGSTNPDDLIAEFTQDNGIHPADGRQGGWYVYGDTNGAFTPPKMGDSPYPIDTASGNPSCSNAGSFHVKASGFNLWGAAAATDFVAKVAGDAGMSAKGLYDGSKYRGISFWAKATKMPVHFVQVKFPDANTDPEVAAPKCILSAANLPNNCSPYLVKLGVPAEFPAYGNTQIGTTWQKFEVLFADAKQDMYNSGYVPAPDKVDVAHLVGFAIQINADFSMNPVAANDFEIWIDDVRFIR